MIAKTSDVLRLLLAAATFAAIVFHPWAAFAAGGAFTIKTTEVAEKGGEWHVKVRIDLPRAPPMMHTPMRFTFSKEAVDERAIMSKGAEPVHHRMVVDTPAKSIVSLDVDFADPSGKVFKSTYFEFDLRRDQGYFEAGEYLVSLSGADGDVGTAQKLTLKGDNPPVYRGAMDFSGDPKTGKKGVKIQSVNNGLDGGDSAGQEGTPSAAPTATEVAAEGNAGSLVPQGAFNKTADEEAVQDHPKGCGCKTAGLEGGSILGGSGAILGLALARALRKKTRSK